MLEAPRIENSAQKERGDNEKFTPEYAARVFFKGLEFSQVENGVAFPIWSVAREFRPGWSLDENSTEEFLQASNKITSRYLGLAQERELPSRHASVSQRKYLEQMPILQGAFVRIFSKLPNEELNQSKPHLLADALIQQDLNYLDSEKGRPQERKGDKRFSYVVSHAVRGKPTGLLVYDEMFELVKDQMVKALRSQKDENWIYRAGKTAMLIKLFNKHHPQDPVTSIGDISGDELSEILGYYQQVLTERSQF